jgi:xanthine dehydrogenase accessory factor
MKELIDTLTAWQAEGRETGRAIVVRTFGSAPRPEGAVMIVSDDGRLAGSVSGGCVEGAAFEEIERARRDGHARVIRYGISDEQAWDVGLACGGTIDVLVEPLVRPEAAAAARDAATTGGRAIVTPLPGDAPPPTFGPHEPGPGDLPAPVLVVHEDGRLDGTLGDPADDAELVRLGLASLAEGTSRSVEIGGRQLFIEAYPLRPRLIIVGAVQVAIPLVAIAKQLGYETVVVDGRATFATRERFPDADQLVVGWPDEVAEQIGLGPADSVAVLTHDVKFDEPAIVESLRRRARYVGAVGSRKTQADRRERLREAGVTDEELAELRGPIGLDLGGRSPAETALAIMAEIIAARHGASGGPMREKARPAEAEAAAGGEAAMALA